MKSLNKIIDNTIGYKPKKTIRNEEIQAAINQRRKSKIRYEKAMKEKKPRRKKSSKRIQTLARTSKNEILQENKRKIENITRKRFSEKTNSCVYK